MADDYDKNPISPVPTEGVRIRSSERTSVTVELSRFAMWGKDGPELDGVPDRPTRGGRQILANIELQPNPDAQAHSDRSDALFARWVASF